MIWLGFSLTVIGWLLAIFAVTMVLNLTGDCGPEVTNCGETPRRISFLVDAFGLIGVGYYAFLFLSGRRKD